MGSVGKVSSLAKQGILDLSQIRFFVLDEADALATGDFLSDVINDDCLVLCGVLLLRVVLYKAAL